MDEKIQLKLSTLVKVTVSTTTSGRTQSSTERRTDARDDPIEVIFFPLSYETLKLSKRFDSPVIISTSSKHQI